LTDEERNAIKEEETKWRLENECHWPDYEIETITTGEGDYTANLRAMDGY